MDGKKIIENLEQQQVILNDERFITINEKVGLKVSKIMNVILIILMVISGYFIKNYSILLTVSIVISIKFVLTLIYSYLYNKKL